MSTYRSVDETYFARRTLRKHARVWSLWAMGVGAVISGDFFGWNFGLVAGGFGGLLVATVVMTVMYAGLCFSIAEMSAALPHTGGAYSFARSAFGPWGGYVTGLAENMEYIFTPSVIVVGIGGYLGAIFGTHEAQAPLWWLAAYAVFVGLNLSGVETAFRFTVVITVLALTILAVFYVGALSHLDLQRWALDVEPDAGGDVWLPKGVPGILASLPFALWLYLGIEQLPLAAEESHDPEANLPRGILYGLVTLIVLSFLTLILNTGIAPGARKLGASNEPLFEGLRTIFGAGLGTRALALVAVAGLVASFHAIIFAYGRQIYSLSRAGYFPHWLSVTHADRQTPVVALITGAMIGYVAAVAVHLLGSKHPVGAVLLNIAVFGAVLSYVLQMASFIALRVRLPHIPRPYVSPLGVAGAAVALAIASLTLAALFFSDPVYRLAALGAAVWYALGLLYFGAYGRKQLVYSPEEEFAERMRRETSSRFQAPGSK